MTSIADNPEWDAIISFWGHAYTFSHDPGGYPDEPYAARPGNGGNTLRAATPGELLDAIKDDDAHRSPATTAKAQP